MDKLYMIEVLIPKIIFAELPVPLKKDIIIQASCGTFAALEIHTDAMGALANLEAKERSSKKKDVDIDCGRSVVFPMEPKKLKQLLKSQPMEVSVMSKKNEVNIGNAIIPWHNNFLEMVENSISTGGYLTPFSLEDQFDLNSPNNEYAGLIHMFIRLSYLGNTVFTNIQKIKKKEDTGDPGTPTASYLFKSVDNATIFECTRHGMGSDSDLMPIGAAYNISSYGVSTRMSRALQNKTTLMTKSTETLLRLKVDKLSTTSIMPSAFRDAPSRRLMPSGGSIASIMDPGQLKGKKMFDLTELHMDVSTFSVLANAMGMHVYGVDDMNGDQEGEEGAGFCPLFIDYKALTVSEIEKRLCKHPDCPAAKLFKDYGIGPLAKNISGTGGMYNDVDAPCTYGMSHCNGTIEGYGPLGKFKRPKQVEDSFLPPTCCKCRQKKSNTSADNPSVSSVSVGSNTKSKSCYTHCPMNPLPPKKPLRLRGGGPDGPGCQPLPNPMTLCQDLMEEYNKVLKEYKDALGPCGQATCPFAMTMIGDACQEICNTSDPEHMRWVCDLTNPEAKVEEQKEFTGCGVPNCPYKRAAISPVEKDFSKYKGMPGCGYTNCPFVRAKLGMEEEENTHLPAFKDYQKQETYKFSDKLPPIHWDCPDPLPKGDCKNPDCPYVKRDALIRKYFPDPCCPCGSSTCPYVCAPCAYPGCPFSIAEKCPPICPYIEKPPTELKCTASVCPFVRMTEVKCEVPECPYRQYEQNLEDCARQMEEERLKAEQEEEEEAEPEDAECKRCGRNRRGIIKPSKSGSFTTRSKSISKTSASNISNTNTGKTCSEPCILSATAYTKKSCRPDTCSTELVCEVCKDAPKRQSRRKEASVVSFTATSSATNPFVEKKIPSKMNAGEESQSKMKDVSLSVPTKTKPPKKNNSKKKKQHLLRKVFLQKKPNLCKNSPFRFDKKSFKPCTKIGHGECVLPKFMVPKNMGWLWNIHNDYCGLRPRRGWKPGAISRAIAMKIDYFNAKRDKRDWHPQPKQKVQELQTKPSHPTVTVHKKAGVVNVTMLPVKDPAEVRLSGDGNPHLDCTPIQFKITKNVDADKPPKVCYCGEVLSTSSSELDIEFSPPAGLKNPLLMGKSGLVDKEVQYNINDVPPPPPPPPKEKKASIWLNVNLCQRHWEFWGHDVSAHLTWQQVNVVVGLDVDTPSRLRSLATVNTADAVIPELPQEEESQPYHTQPLPVEESSEHTTEVATLPPSWFWRHFISWQLSAFRFSCRFFFLTIDINFRGSVTEHERIPEPVDVIIMSQEQNLNTDTSSSSESLRISRTNENNQIAPLRLRGGGPIRPKTPKMPSPSADCKDLMAGFDKLMADYKKALGPCGQATCPMNQNVLEDCCKKVCQKPPPPPRTPYCPPSMGTRICPHLQDYSMIEGEEDIDISKLGTCFDKCASPPDGRDTEVCKQPSCPFAKRTQDEDPFDDNYDDGTSEVCKTIKAPKTALKCTKHVCPFKKDELTVDDVNPFNRKLKPKKGCGSPLCPHVVKMEVPEVTMPKFPCRKPCPSTDELPPIHWECPDPLPTGECVNPFCPYREKPPCGHCPIDANHCGYPGCPFAGDNICPPTCPYTQKKPPKNLQCTPSICPLMRPDNYHSMPAINQQKRKSGKNRCIKKSPCKNPECPYDNQSSHSVDECSDPDCPYKQAAKRLVENKIGEPCTLDTIKYTRVTEEDTVFNTKMSPSGNSAKEPGGVEFRESTKLKKATSKKSTAGLLKLMTASLMQLKKKQELEENGGDEANICRQSSCAYYNGERMCKKCLQKKQNNELNDTPMGDNNTSLNSEKKDKKKRKKHYGYVYDKGTYYPGIKFGHRQCNIHPPRVPWDMGWLWNKKESCVMLKTRRGWRPGAIGRTILESINAYRHKLGLPPRPMFRHPFPKRRARSSSSGFHSSSRKGNSRSKGSHEPSLAQPKPTLSIKKKDGIVYVTMNPLKDPATMEDNEYPYIDCSPLEFKIIKKSNEDDVKCLCNGEDDGSDKSSELDIEFTPPAGIVRPECMLRNRHICHTESQYNKADIPETEEERLAREKKGKSQKGKKGKKGKK